jgi:uncharacterized protein YciI
VPDWIYFIHPPRDNFAATMSDAERDAFRAHWAHLQKLMEAGILVLAGPTLGVINTGIAVLEAPDEATARDIMESDPVIARGVCGGELREYKISLLRGRD